VTGRSAGWAKSAGKQVEYFEYAGQPRSFQGADNQLYLRRIAEFFEQHLQGAEGL
jgi:hypothetical protein